MATSKTLTPTNETIQIPEFTDQPDQRVNSNCIDKEADAINTLHSNLNNRTNFKHTTVTVDTSEWQNQALTPFTKYVRKLAGASVHIKNISPRMPSQGWIIACGVDVNNDTYFYALANGAGSIVFDVIYTS